MSTGYFRIFVVNSMVMKQMFFLMLLFTAFMGVRVGTTEEAQLLDIAGSGTKTGYKAQAILFAARGTDFPVVLPALASGGE